MFLPQAHLTWLLLLNPDTKGSCWIILTVNFPWVLKLQSNTRERKSQTCSMTYQCCPNYLCGLHYPLPVMVISNVLYPTHFFMGLFFPSCRENGRYLGNDLLTYCLLPLVILQQMLKMAIKYPDVACWKIELWRYHITFPKSQKLCVLEKEQD